MEKIFSEKSKDLILTSDKMKKYFISFQTNINSELQISAYPEENSGKRYSNNYSIDLLKKNKYLNTLDTIEEIFEEIMNKISFKTPILYEEPNCLKIVIRTLHTKYKDITFYLNQKEKNTNDKIEELYSIINHLKEKELIQDEKIRLLELRISELEKGKDKIIQEENIPLEESLILKDNNDYLTRLKNWINPYKNVDFKLLYRMSRDGESIKTFHRLCDNKGPTVTLYLLYDGNIIGGYTPLHWDTHSGWKKDNDTFVFNISTNLICTKIHNYTNSIYCHVSYSGFFGTLGYYEDSKDSMKKLFYFNSDNIFRNGNKILNFNNTTEIEPKEVEIFSAN